MGRRKGKRTCLVNASTQLNVRVIMFPSKWRPDCYRLNLEDQGNPFPQPSDDSLVINYCKHINQFPPVTFLLRPQVGFGGTNQVGSRWRSV